MGVLKKSLPNDILVRAQQFFGADFSDVTWCIDESPRPFNTCALAHKNEIVITADVLEKSNFERQKIFIHELAHVLQQQPQLNRSNQKKQNNRTALPIKQSEQHLENEAQLATKRFVQGYKQLPFNLTDSELQKSETINLY